MGSSLSRHLRDLGDVGGFEGIIGFGSEPNPATVKVDTSTQSCPSTPTANQPVRVLDLDPRSPTAEIVRTPIEVASKFPFRGAQDSPMTPVLHARRSYLETDLDTLSTSEFASKPENVSNCQEASLSLPPGLSTAHLLKLKFMGVDPRSPSADIARTPIQIIKKSERSASPLHFDDTLSIGSVSVSSQDIFSNSMCSSEFTRDCSDPSAFISECDISDKEDEDVAVPLQDSILNTTEDALNEPSAEILSRSITKLMVFQEDEATSCDSDKPAPVTPENTKKPSGNRTRTPLTPICNHSRTPNSIIRAKQSQSVQREILTKAKIYSTDENILTPSKIRSVGGALKENNTSNGRGIRKGLANIENAPLSNNKKPIRAQWDQDTSVVI